MVQNENNNEIIDTVDDENTALQTSFAEINLTPTITETSNFQKVLDEIPMHVEKADKLLKDYRTDKIKFIETVDDDVIEAQLKEMSNVTGFIKDVNTSRTEIRKFFDTKRNEVVAVLDERLAQASFDKLGTAQEDIKQLQKDMSVERAEVRWNELKDTFIANVQRYPLISEFAPELADFSRFRLLNAKLVSGAKTVKITKKHHTTVNEAVYGWNTGIELIKDNEWQLSPHDLNQLLTLFKQEPTIELVNREGRQLKINAEAKEKARIETEQRRLLAVEQAKVAEAKRVEDMARIQEQARLAKISQDKNAMALAEQQRVALEKRSKELAEQERIRLAELNQFGGQYKTIFKESFPNFIAYLFTNTAYHDVHSNPATKAHILYDIMHQVSDQNSVVVKETANDPQKILDLVRYILDA